MVLARSTKHLKAGCPENAQIVFLTWLAAHRFIRTESFFKIVDLLPGSPCCWACSTGLGLRESMGTPWLCCWVPTDCCRVRFWHTVCPSLLWHAVLLWARLFTSCARFTWHLVGRVGPCLGQGCRREDLWRVPFNAALRGSTTGIAAPFVKNSGFYEWGVLYKSQLLLLFMLFIYWSHFSELRDGKKKINQQIHFVYIQFHFQCLENVNLLNTTPSPKSPSFPQPVETLHHS